MAQDAFESGESLGLPEVEVVAPVLVEDVPADDSRIGRNLIKSLNTAMALGYMSAVATAAEYSGYTNRLPEAPRLIASSSAHPVLGYVGAWAADLVTYKASKKVKVAAMFTAATIADFATEKAQSLIIASPQYVDFLSSRNLPETAKDYGFSLLGMGLYMLQQRRSRKSQ